MPCEYLAPATHGINQDAEPLVRASASPDALLAASIDHAVLTRVLLLEAGCGDFISCGDLSISTAADLAPFVEHVHFQRGETHIRVLKHLPDALPNMTSLHVSGDCTASLHHLSAFGPRLTALRIDVKVADVGSLVARLPGLLKLAVIVADPTPALLAVHSALPLLEALDLRCAGHQDSTVLPRSAVSVPPQNTPKLGDGAVKSSVAVAVPRRKVLRLSDQITTPPKEAPAPHTEPVDLAFSQLRRLRTTLRLPVAAAFPPLCLRSLPSVADLDLTIVLEDHGGGVPFPLASFWAALFAAAPSLERLTIAVRSVNGFHGPHDGIGSLFSALQEHAPRLVRICLDVPEECSCVGIEGLGTTGSQGVLQCITLRGRSFGREGNYPSMVALLENLSGEKSRLRELCLSFSCSWADPLPPVLRTLSSLAHLRRLAIEHGSANGTSLFEVAVAVSDATNPLHPRSMLRIEELSLQHFLHGASPAQHLLDEYGPFPLYSASLRLLQAPVSLTPEMLGGLCDRCPKLQTLGLAGTFFSAQSSTLDAVVPGVTLVDDMMCFTSTCDTPSA